MPTLNNTNPIDPLASVHAPWLGKLQGNILAGHGRDFTAHIFLELPSAPADAKKLVRQFTEEFVTSALRQATEREQFKKWKIPGRLFGTLLLSATGYAKLGFTDLSQFKGLPTNQPRATEANFVSGMAQHAVADFGDPPRSDWEPGYRAGNIDAMLLLADDDEDLVLRTTRRLLDALPTSCKVLQVERGAALRTDTGEGIEHFGYVDGRSQPLFLATDFENLNAGAIDLAKTTESKGHIDKWNPFATLDLVLVPDPLRAGDPDSLGSYFVFRKLEQNVREFLVAEQHLADTLGLTGTDRERAGAMAVGRFRDGTPLVVHNTDGQMPAKENNFNYLGDPNGLKCPFHAHIRKTNPRGETAGDIADDGERGRRIARRGIPFGERTRHPNAFQALDDLPSHDVGLLFMCYQADITHQFAFMQRTWANNQNFLKPNPTTGLDPVIGQKDASKGPNDGQPAAKVPQTWHPEYNVANGAKQSQFDGFVKMRGGEFFFAPSIPFLQGL